MVPKAVLIKSSSVSVNTARQVNAAHSKTTVNAARPMTYLSKTAHSTVKRLIQKNTAFKNSNINQRVNTIRSKNVNTARPKAVVNAVKGNHGNPQMDLQDQGAIDSGCSRHMTRNMSYLTDYEEIDGGYVAFGGNPKGGKITKKRVLVVKHHKKTPYELFHDRTPSLSFIRPFGYPVTILNTLYHLGKFDGKADEDFFVGYSLNSKAFRVFNSKTRIVEENLHIRFSKSTPNVVGSRPDWLFDINALTRTINYKPIVAVTQSNSFADPKSSQDDGFKPSSDDGKKVDEDPSKGNECNDLEKKDNVNSTNNVNTVSSTINTAGTNRVNIVGEILFDLDMPALKDIGTFDFSNKDEDDDAVADMNNLDITIQVSPTPTTKIHKDHPLDQVIEDLQSATQTRNMTKNLEEHGFVSTIQQRTNHKDLQNCLFACFLSQEEPKNIEKEVYVCQPLGFEDPDFPDRVYKVEKTLYGLHQAPRAWYETLLTYLLDNGFQRGKIDKTLFIKRQKDEFYRRAYILLGITSETKNDGIFISQDKYVTKILKKFRFTKVKNASTPMETQKPLLKDEDGKEVDFHMKPTRKVTEVPQPSDPIEHVADEAVHKELRDRLVRATTVASSLKAKQDNGNIDKTQSKTTPNESSSQGTNSGGGPRCQEAMGDTTAQTRLESLDNEKKLGDDASKQEMRIDDIDVDEDITLVNVQDDTKMFDTDKDLGGEEVFVEQEVVPNKEKIDEVTLAHTLAELKTLKPKAKGLKSLEFDKIQEMFDRSFKRVNKFEPIRSELVEGKEKRAEEGLIQKRAKKQKVEDDKETAELTQLMEIIPNEEDVAIDAIPLAVKSPGIVDWKIHKEGKKSYYQIIRADGKSKIDVYQVGDEREVEVLRSFNWPLSELIMKDNVLPERACLVCSAVQKVRAVALLINVRAVALLKGRWFEVYRDYLKMRAEK
uniref:Putative ribonuclease H-like domain-containing protein n=1 Tax=Tanacetum cinerariifolium TaxID=118510 RepID=A0A6L2KIT0_TANCI|nr:putative ribonuclease H-like domain-containing protein [Tanacetum cinerariifolium]